MQASVDVPWVNASVDVTWANASVDVPWINASVDVPWIRLWDGKPGSRSRVFESRDEYNIYREC